mmetsp:Transcript_1105/g.682  ORF Transcript_1105/g.682 Transcript_1105/m.682 type:complete len:86 (-) Transcript_1105:85-342(-)
MAREIDDFWNGIPVKCENLEIDYENLNGIAIYVVLQTKNPLLILDIIFIENFVSQAIMFTNRAYHMTVIHSALDFIEERITTYNF